MTLSAQHLYDVCEATWPPAQAWQSGPWTLRNGQGGGKRVSSATADGPWTLVDIDAAATEMTQMAQTPLFMVREGEERLDLALADKGYQRVDPVTLYTLPIAKLTDVPIPRVTAFEIWEPLAIMNEIWAQGGIGPARLDVMARAKTKTALLARWNEKPAGVAFAGVHAGTCMVHALEVLPHQRRQGVAVWMMRRAAFWGQSQGADHMSVLCVAQNLAANRLYQTLGFVAAGGYHYRQLNT